MLREAYDNRLQAGRCRPRSSASSTLRGSSGPPTRTCWTTARSAPGIPDPRYDQDSFMGSDVPSQAPAGRLPAGRRDAGRPGQPRAVPAHRRARSLRGPCRHRGGRLGSAGDLRHVDPGRAAQDHPRRPAHRPLPRRPDEGHGPCRPDPVPALLAPRRRSRSGTARPTFPSWKTCSGTRSRTWATWCSTSSRRRSSPIPGAAGQRIDFKSDTND